MAVKLNKGGVLSSLSLTPLIDVVFLLLIFFLVASRFEEEERSMEVKLPAASEAQPLTAKPNTTFINIDKTGKYIVQQNVVDAKQLQLVLKAISDKNPETAKVTIRADEGTHWKFVVAAMNMCNKAKIFNYDVATEE